MLSTFTFSEILSGYTLILLGILVLLHCFQQWRARNQDWHIHRMTVHKCAKCGLVFAVGRFARRTSVVCPRCENKSSIYGKSQD